MPRIIALVDDDQNILTSVTYALEAEGYKVQTYKDGAAALDGMELLSRLHQKGHLPVIFLTSKDDEIDEMLGLRMGADDYITKPFSQRLLIERIRAVLRRHDLLRSGATEGNGGDVITRGEMVLDSARHMCTWSGRQVDLTVTEFLLVKALAGRPGHVKNRNQLIDAAYGEHIYVEDRTVDSHVKRLRKKFKDIDPDFAQIETLYGVGYRFRDD